ncbi:unnamed protein product [Rotaria socialis]|uniref:G-protein coupled receptors family 1 profile domain-containing protein n=1 Tax=Rotaria socialis TaxID=392032 RepID=A0A821DPY3_9BILA|nr:unnamed protein product [Rotaria socialis]CAF4624727.1 unnamed protein product [Rotaria socialis]
MCQSSYNESLIIELDSVLTQFNRYVLIIILLFGIVGNILNIIVLSQRSLRANPCAWIFLVASIVNLISILTGLITRMLSDWVADPTTYIRWVCRLRAYAVSSTRTMAPWLIALATIDL